MPLHSTYYCKRHVQGPKCCKNMPQTGKRTGPRINVCVVHHQDLDVELYRAPYQKAHVPITEHLQAPYKAFLWRLKMLKTESAHACQKVR